MDSEVFEKVKMIVSQQLEIDPDRVTPTSHLATELGADMLDAVELIQALESEFGIRIDSEVKNEIDNLTVSELVEKITMLI
jgi:acyl carrier protein